MKRTTAFGMASVIGAGVALGVGELVAGLVDSIPSPVSSIGSWVVDVVPSWLEDVAIGLFGTADKGALGIGTVVVVLVIAWKVGTLSEKRQWLVPAVFTLFAGIGLVASLDQPLTSPMPTVVAAGASLAGGIAMAVWIRSLVNTDEDPTDAIADDASRRRFIRGALVGGSVAVVAGGVGRRMLAATPETPAVTIAPPGASAPPPTAANTVEVEGITPLVVPNDEFYRIDTALLLPRIDPSSWSLRVHGLVAEELRFSYDELSTMDLVEDYVTIACVSNEVGGNLIGNAKWTGVRLVDVLDRAGVQPEATQVVGRSIDDWTAGFPTELALDGREPLIALAMNDEPLPVRHGFPARLIVPGLYGYVSATKWLTEIELTTWEAHNGYWIPRGWAKEAPVKTQSRIDVPLNRASVTAGRTVVAGVAWAPLKGVERVEVRVDDDPWIDAEVSVPLSSRAWVQWRAEVDLTAGSRRVFVRATDGTGAVQTDEVVPPRPDGATGHHSIRLDVG